MEIAAPRTMVPSARAARVGSSIEAKAIATEMGRRVPLKVGMEASCVWENRHQDTSARRWRRQEPTERGQVLEGPDPRDRGAHLGLGRRAADPREPDGLP